MNLHSPNHRGGAQAASAGGFAIDGSTQRNAGDAAHPVVEYEECGSGDALVLVPGSCSTGAAWRPVTAHLAQDYRCITTSLPGYGRTAERRSAEDVSIDHQCEAVEEVIARAGQPVHLVGHSFGGLVALAVALRGKAALASLAIFEAPAVGLLDRCGEAEHLAAFRRLTDSYFSAYGQGQKDAIGAMVDFYGGAGTFASWPERVRAHAIATTPVNLLDWGGAYAYRPRPEQLSALGLPVLVCVGGLSHPAARRANELIRDAVVGARFAEIDGAAHFMIATHADEVAAVVADHAGHAKGRR